MSSRRLAIAVLAPAALVLPAAPAAAKTPKPRTAIRAWAQQWQQAGRSGDCTFLGGVYSFPSSDAASCGFYTNRLARVKVLKTQAFGTGALIRWSAPNSQSGVPRESVYFSTRRAGGTAWEDTSVVTGIFGYLGIDSIGTKPNHVKAMDAAAASYVKILRTKNCNRLYALEKHPVNATKAKQCAGTFAASLATLLRTHPRAKAVRLGGNGSWGFYGLDLGRRYLTIPIRFDLDRKIRVLTWYYS